MRTNYLESIRMKGEVVIWTINIQLLIIINLHDDYFFLTLSTRHIAFKARKSRLVVFRVHLTIVPHFVPLTIAQHAALSTPPVYNLPYLPQCLGVNVPIEDQCTHFHTSCNDVLRYFGPSFSSLISPPSPIELVLLQHSGLFINQFI